MTALCLAKNDLHDVQVGDRRILFHVPTTGLFELDGTGAEIVDLFRERGSVRESDVRDRFDGRRDPAEVVAALQELMGLGLVGDGRPAHPPAPVTIREFPLSTVVLNVNTGCNLACSYCYKEDLTTPADGGRMDAATAIRAIDLLFAEAAGRERVNVVFFGGEPLTNMPVIREAVAYAEARARALGKRVDFALTTNALLLTEELIDWLDSHRFGITVSIDGPRELHDRNRRTVGGKGSYDAVAAKVRLLLGRYRSKPVGARVTLTRGITDVVGIHRHLVEELGFFEAGFAPVTAGPASGTALTGEELRTVFAGMEELGRRYLDAAVEGRNIGFGNLNQLVTELSEGTAKTLPCGAGLGMLAVDRAGDLHLCHRFTGTEVPTFGNVTAGWDKPRQGAFLEEAANRADPQCQSCWIRRLCAGGCYHEAYTAYSDTLHPNTHYCDLMRRWVEFGVHVYAEIARRNPAFIDTHIAPRRARG